MKNKKNRLAFIDIAKGIGILTVVLGHILSKSQGLCWFIYSFHMPLFLIMSGFFEKEQDNFKTYLLKTTKRLYLPYLAYVVLDYILYYFFYDRSLKNALILGARAAIGMEIAINLPIWFLFALFVVKIIFQLLHLIRNKKVQTVFIMIIIFGGFLYMHVFDKVIFYAIFTIVPALTFYSIGYLLKDLSKRPFWVYTHKIRSKKIRTTIAMVLCLLLAAFLSQVNGDVGVLGCHFGNTLFFISTGISGAYGFIILSSILASSIKLRPRFILYIGKHSLAIQVTHYYLTEYAAPYILEKASKADLRYDPLVEFIIFVSTVLVCLLIIFIKEYAKSRMTRAYE